MAKFKERIRLDMNQAKFYVDDCGSGKEVDYILMVRCGSDISYASSINMDGMEEYMYMEDYESFSMLTKKKQKKFVLNCGKSNQKELEDDNSEFVLSVFCNYNKTNSQLESKVYLFFSFNDNISDGKIHYHCIKDDNGDLGAIFYQGMASLLLNSDKKSKEER